MKTFLKAGACALFLGVALMAACGDEVTQVTPAASSSSTTSGMGGAGGGTTTTTGGSTTTSANGGAGTGGGFGGGNACDQACRKLEQDCGFPGACQQLMLDCDNPQTECPGQCILDATCTQIATLATNMPDPTLRGCLQTCQGGQGGGGGNQMGCGQCAQSNCSTELGACQNDMSQICQAYFQCVTQCQTPQCEQNCLATHNNTASVNLSSCVCASCSQCPICP